MGKSRVAMGCFPLSSTDAYVVILILSFYQLRHGLSYQDNTIFAL